MLSLKQVFGQKNETIAVRYLEKKGYRIVERNYRNYIGEIDIIAKDGPSVVFIEVKARRNALFGTPKGAVTLRKQKTLSKVALVWMKAARMDGVRARFDVVAISYESGKRKVELIKNAFEKKYGW